MDGQWVYTNLHIPLGIKNLALSVGLGVLFPKLQGQALERKYRRQFCIIQGRKMGSVGACQENEHPRTAQHWHFQSPGREKEVKDPETNYLKNYQLIK